MVIFGAFGMLGGCVGAAVVVMFTAASESLQSGPARPGMEIQAAQAAAMSKYLVPVALSGVVSIGLGGLLLASGVGVLKRRRWGARLGIAWSVIKMIYAIPATLIGYLVNVEQFKAMADAAEQSAVPVSGFYAMISTYAPYSVWLGLLWTWALPVFLLIWFSRRFAKAERSRWS